MINEFIHSFTCLQDRKNSDRAMQILKKVGSLVKPIMRNHGWVLPVFSEFYPDNPNLLGLSASFDFPRLLWSNVSRDVNGGQKILIRLRPHFDPDAFLEEEEVVQIVLHELTHNVHGPHDDKFYKLLSKLQEEYDGLRLSGYAGEGFFSPGQRVGLSLPNLTPHGARMRAIQAAERRNQLTRTMGNSGGRRLGSANDRTRLSVQARRDLAAAAAERRARDEKTCGQGDLAVMEAERAAQSSMIIDLTLDDTDVDIPPPAGSSRSQEKPRASQMASSTTAYSWSCETCTLLNHPSVSVCDACLSGRPVDKDSWACLFCGQTGMSHDFWSCRSCGQIKLKS